jgi:hypothetical protein
MPQQGVDIFGPPPEYGGPPDEPEPPPKDPEPPEDIPEYQMLGAQQPGLFASLLSPQAMLPMMLPTRRAEMDPFLDAVNMMSLGKRRPIVSGGLV